MDENKNSVVKSISVLCEQCFFNKGNKAFVFA